MIKHGQPSGFGIYFSDTGKIKIGWLRDGAMVGKARIIDSSGLIMDSTFKNDQAHGETLIYHIKKNDWKQISIDNDKVEEMDLGKGYPRFELNRANRWVKKFSIQKLFFKFSFKKISKMFSKIFFRQEWLENLTLK